MSKTEIKAMVKTIDPEQAAKWLEHNDHNRPMNGSNVETIAKALQSGEWVVNGTPIIIASDGMLLDGQHRLYAVVRSGISLTSVVVTGVDPSVFDTIDTGKKRTAKDVLDIAFKNKLGTSAGKMAQLIKLYFGGYLFGSINKPEKLTNHQIVQLYDKHSKKLQMAMAEGQKYYFDQPIKFFTDIECAALVLIKEDMPHFDEYWQWLLALEPGSKDYGNFWGRAAAALKKGRNAKIRGQLWFGFFQNYKQFLENKAVYTDYWYKTSESVQRNKEIPYPHSILREAA